MNRLWSMVNRPPSRITEAVMATYTIKAIKYCEQTVPGPQMFFMARWDEWLIADFFLFVLRRDDGR